MKHLVHPFSKRQSYVLLARVDNSQIETCCAPQDVKKRKELNTSVQPITGTKGWGVCILLAGFSLAAWQ
jgi:hypothetical protein